MSGFSGGLRPPERSKMSGWGGRFLAHFRGKPWRRWRAAFEYWEPWAASYNCLAPLHHVVVAAMDPFPPVVAPTAPFRSATLPVFSSERRQCLCAARVSLMVITDQ